MGSAQTPELTNLVDVGKAMKVQSGRSVVNSQRGKEMCKTREEGLHAGRQKGRRPD